MNELELIQTYEEYNGQMALKQIEKRERETHGTGDLGQSFGCDGHSGDPCQFPRKVGEAYQEYAAVCVDVQDRKEHNCACWREDGLCTSYEAR